MSSTRKKQPAQQPIGKAVVGCLRVVAYRSEQRTQRGRHICWAANGCSIEITHRLHGNFEVADHYLDSRELADKEDPFSETGITHPKDTLTYAVQAAVLEYADVFLGMPTEAKVRQAVSVAYKTMRDIERTHPTESQS